MKHEYVGLSEAAREAKYIDDLQMEADRLAKELGVTPIRIKRAARIEITGGGDDYLNRRAGGV